MKRTSTFLAAWLSVVGVSAVGAPVRAQQPPPPTGAQAQALFDEGLALMKAGKFADACPKLAESQKLDPGMGTQYRLAECYQSAGLIGSAFTLFNEVAESARQANRPDRESQARQQAEALRPRLPMMTITIPPALSSLPGFDLKRDGEAVDRKDWNQPKAVDPGVHVITAAAPGKKAWQETVRALEGAKLEVAVPALADETGTSGVPPVASAETSGTAPPGSNRGFGQRLGAVAAGVVGLAGIGVGIGLGLKAKSDWDEALTHCQNQDKSKCDSSGIGLASDASTSGTISTVGFVVGGAGLAAAAILWFTAPASTKKASSGLEFVPAIAPEGPAGVIRGRF